MHLHFNISKSVNVDWSDKHQFCPDSLPAVISKEKLCHQCFKSQR